MTDKKIEWNVAIFPTFGIKESPIMVEGLQATIKGITWQICQVKNNKTNVHGTYCNDKYYLTNTKRTHLSFHKNIPAAIEMARSGGHTNKTDQWYYELERKKK